MDRNRVLLRAALPPLVFLLVQLVGSLCLSVYVVLQGGGEDAVMSPMALSVCLLLTNVVTAVVCVRRLQMIRFPESLMADGMDWKWAAVAIVSATLGILATNVCSEMADLPDVLKDAMLGIANNPVGVLTVCVVGPIVEELVFREAVCGHLLRSGVRPTTAVVISAAIFGVVHLNPAQVLVAFVIGMVLGVMYLRTGNVVLSSIMHIINNSTAVVLLRVMGDEAEEFSFVELLGGEANARLVALAAFALAAAGLYIFLKKYKNERE